MTLKKTATIYYGGFLHKSGGAFMHARTINDQLCKMGWDVAVITLDSLPIWCRYLPHLTQIVVNLIRKPLGFSYKGAVTRILYKSIFRKKVDLHIFEDVYLAWNSDIPSVSVLHAVWSDNLQSYALGAEVQNKLRKVEADAINRLTHPVVTVSQPYLKYLEDEHFAAYRLRKIDVVELGLDQSKFSREGDGHGNRRSIVFSGYLEARKNVLFLLRVFKQLHALDPEYKLTIIGNGPELASLSEFARDNALEVNFLGKLSHERVLIELRRHGIYLHTSVKESFSYSLLEAKLTGLKTCAYAGLQVPDEFIDAAVDTFEVDAWCRAIVGIESAPNRFHPARYSAREMTLKTLALVGLGEHG